MRRPTAKTDGTAVPADRISRLARLGGLAGGIAGGMLVDGARHLARGQRPRLGDLLLTPVNAARVANQLAQLRGAAMKMGQLLSMDAGEFLPPEMAAILARLRDAAEHMPPAQLQTTLDAQWGKGWRKRFARFDVRPIAAASIGQVHRAQTRDGRDLAIKVQYPGVRRSIDSDVGNVATLLRMSGFLPEGIDVKPLLSEARSQLHQEADYLREAEHLNRFAALLDGSDDFLVPRTHPDLCTDAVLAMDYVESVPIESLEHADAGLRNRVAELLIGLMLREMFTFGLMQTDPNFANYRYTPETGRIVLLDFGASRDVPPDLGAQCRDLLDAGLRSDRTGLRRASLAIGYFAETTPVRHQDAILDMLDLAMTPFRTPGPIDFASTDLVLRLRDMGLAIGSARDLWHIPPAETLFLHRKAAGLYLLANRLGARLDLQAMAAPYASPDP